jgi:hypothetical protein
MPKDPPPNPSTPPNGAYTSTCGPDFNTWDGSFTYTNGTIVYDRTGVTPSQKFPSTTNKSHGNAIVFDLTDTSVTPHVTVQFNGPTFVYTGPNGNQAQYSGHCEQLAPIATEDGWTATQTS